MSEIGRHSGSSTRSSNAGLSRPDMTSSQPTICRSSNSHQSEFGCVRMSPRPNCRCENWFAKLPDDLGDCKEPRAVERGRLGWSAPLPHLQALALPVRQNTRAVGQCGSVKIFHFTEIRKRRMRRPTPAQGRGAYRDRHERGPGGGGRGPYRREGFCRAGNREQKPRAHDRCDPRTAKSCGPDARGLCVKARGDACGPTGPSHQSSARRRGQ
jgi:hypothetical protein